MHDEDTSILSFPSTINLVVIRSYEPIAESVELYGSEGELGLTAGPSD